MELIPQQFDVRGIRQAASMSIEGLARALEVSARTVFRWEHGDSKPQPRHLQKLRDFVKAEKPTLTWS